MLLHRRSDGLRHEDSMEKAFAMLSKVVYASPRRDIAARQAFTSQLEMKHLSEYALARLSTAGHLLIPDHLSVSCIIYAVEWCGWHVMAMAG